MSESQENHFKKTGLPMIDLVELSERGLSVRVGALTAVAGAELVGQAALRHAVGRRRVGEGRTRVGGNRGAGTLGLVTGLANPAHATQRL